MSKIHILVYEAENIGGLSVQAPDRIVVRLLNGKGIRREISNVRGTRNLPLSDAHIGFKARESFAAVIAE